jgi:hypothetical protein
MFALLALGIAVAIVGAVVLAEEWRRAGTQNARLNKFGLRFEHVGGGAVLIGVGVAIAHAGVGS